MRALVLCAGYGTRLGPLTKDMPKPMLPIAGKPLLAWTLQYLASWGFSDIAINLHYRPEAITSHFGDGSAFGVRLHYSYEETPLGTAGAVKKLERFFAGEDDFLVLYGDLLIDQDLSALVRFHRSQRAFATLLLHQRAGSNSLVRMGQDGRITAFVERPSDAQCRELAYPWVNSGVQVLSRGVFPFLPPGKPADLPKDLYSPVVGKQRLFGFPLSGYRCAIDSIERYEEAQSAVLEGHYRVVSAASLSSSVAPTPS